jgi:hypothetical protein
MTSKDILLADKETAAWWNGVTKHPFFPKIVLLARSHVADWKDIAEIQGGKNMLEVLESFAENPMLPKKPLSAGLKHDFKSATK